MRELKSIEAWFAGRSGQTPPDMPESGANVNAVPGEGERATELPQRTQEAMTRLGRKARAQVERAFDWLPKTAAPVATRSETPPGAQFDRQTLLKSLSDQYGYPIIETGKGGSRFSPELVVGHDPFGEEAEAIRSIRSEIAVAALGQGRRSFLVVGPRSGVGATYLAGNLAVAFAQMGISTLLVDANLRRPRVANLFGISPDSEGLVELVVRKSLTPSPIQYNVIPNLSVLPSGAVPPNPQELLASPEFLALTDTFQSHFGVVIYDSAPGLDFADAMVVASRVGSAIMVARQHKTYWQESSQLARKLAALQCTLVGSVLNTY